jgi:hypothetical protein
MRGRSGARWFRFGHRGALGTVDSGVKPPLFAVYFFDRLHGTAQLYSTASD